MKKIIILIVLFVAAFSGYAQMNTFGGIGLRVNDTTTYQTNAATYHSAGYRDIYFNNQATNKHFDIWNGSSYDHVFNFGGTSGGGGSEFNTIPSGFASGTDTYTTTVPGITGYNDSTKLILRFENANTGDATIDINGIGVVPILGVNTSGGYGTAYLDNLSNLPTLGGGGWISAGIDYLLTYNVSYGAFQIQGNEYIDWRSSVLGYKEGATWKQSVRVATTANGTFSTAFDNGSTIDGITLATNDRILIKNQTSSVQNGIYIVQTSGSPVRALDMDGTVFNSAFYESDGAVVYVEVGTTNAGKTFKQTTSPSIIGTNNLVFVDLYTAGSTPTLDQVIDAGSVVNNTVTIQPTIDNTYDFSLFGTNLFRNIEFGAFNDLLLTALEDFEIESVNQDIKLTTSTNSIFVSDMVDKTYIDTHLYGYTATNSPTTGYFPKYNGTNITWDAPSAGPINNLLAATGANTINNAAHAQEWQWNSLTSGTGLTLSSSSTAAASNTNTVFRVNQTGANATSSQETAAGYFSNTKTGTGAGNVGLWAVASGGSYNIAIAARGGVSIIGTATEEPLIAIAPGNHGVFLNIGGTAFASYQNGDTDLGTSSQQFKNLYLSGNSRIGALDTDVTAPTPSGVTALVITDDTGTQSFTNTPSVTSITSTVTTGQTNVVQVSGATTRKTYEKLWYDNAGVSGNYAIDIFNGYTDATATVVFTVTAIKSDGSESFGGEYAATFNKDGATTVVQVDSTTPLYEHDTDNAATFTVDVTSNMPNINFNTGDLDSYRWTVWAKVTITQL